jgi:hypothetical protein
MPDSEFEVPDDAVPAMTDRIRRVLDTPGIARLVAAHFDPAGPFVGRDLDQLGDNPPNRITRDDLLAVSLLGITWQPSTVRRILGADAGALADLLAPITNMDLWLADDALLKAASAAWHRLRDAGVGTVAAGKLLARKRPRLIPIVDQVIRRALQPPRNRVWATLRGCLQDEALRQRVEEIQPAGAYDISALRLLDVVIWMRHSRSRGARRYREGAELPEAEPGG